MHEKNYVADEHIYPMAEFERMKADIRAIMDDGAAMEWHLSRQHRHAMAEDKEAYRKIFDGNNDELGMKIPN